MKTEIRRIKIVLMTPQLGTVPKDPNAFIFMNERAGVEPKADELECLPPVVAGEEKGVTGFMTDTDGLFIFDYLIKGFFKNAANVLKEQEQITGFRSKIQQFLFVYPRKVRTGHMFPGEILRRPITINDRNGQRVAIAASETIPEGTEMTFYLEFIENAVMNDATIASCLEYGRLCGLGQFRGGGYGRFITLEYEALDALPDEAKSKWEMYPTPLVIYKKKKTDAVVGAIATPKEKPAKKLPAEKAEKAKVGRPRTNASKLPPGGHGVGGAGVHSSEVPTGDKSFKVNRDFSATHASELPDCVLPSGTAKPQR
jgi:hypothetical protein